MKFVTIVRSLFLANVTAAQSSSTTFTGGGQHVRTNKTGVIGDAAPNSANTKVTNLTTFTLTANIGGQQLEIDPFTNGIYINSGFIYECPHLHSCDNVTDSFKPVYALFNFGSARGALALNTSVTTPNYAPGVPQQQIHIEETGALRWTFPIQTITIYSATTGFKIVKGTNGKPDTLSFTGEDVFKAGPFVACPIPAFAGNGKYYAVYVKTALFNQVGCVEFVPVVAYSTAGVPEYT